MGVWYFLIFNRIILEKHVIMTIYFENKVINSNDKSSWKLYLYEEDADCEGDSHI